MRTFFSAKMDRFALIVTSVLRIFWLFSLFMLFSDKSQTQKIFTIVFILLSLIMLVTYLLIPRLFLGQGKLAINTQLFSKEILFSDIAEVYPSEKVIHIRTFGIGGIFGYFGYFNGKELWLVTSQKKKVVVKTNQGKTFVVSPSKNELFLQELVKHISNKDV